MESLFLQLAGVAFIATALFLALALVMLVTIQAIDKTYEDKTLAENVRLEIAYLITAGIRN
jgi:hypothetical protein